jgi:hypothetical protein
MDSEVDALAVSGSDVYAGGGFTSAGGKVSFYVAKAIAIPDPWLSIAHDVHGPNTNTAPTRRRPGHRGSEVKKRVGAVQKSAGSIAFKCAPPPNRERRTIPELRTPTAKPVAR